MKRAGRWEEHCIWHEDNGVRDFCQGYFRSDNRRQVAFFTAGGFDPRTGQIPRLLAQHIGKQFLVFFLREERDDKGEELLTIAKKNLSDLRNLFPDGQEWSIEIFDGTDRHVVGGRRLADRFKKTLPTLQHCTDVVLDLSAFSTGIIFTLTRLAWGLCRQSKSNLHILISYHPDYDARITSYNHDKATPIHGFHSPDEQDGDRNKARLWIPHFSPGKQKAIREIHKILKSVRELDICPALPFPAVDPRTADEDAVKFIEEFQEWRIDARHILHAAQDDPLDLYRQILAVHRAREQVFEGLQDSQTILSPAGSKILSLGFLLAALDYDLPVMYVESVHYQLKSEAESSPVAKDSMKLFHLWLLGTPYPNNADTV
uniref:Uncharacterized protein n=1 Tax=Candidatus Kentrum sp. LPFa TaxID=2126335 RepID=A0A450W2L2_9GAMM|nr:MAG: hypothetical protein BECKLPF1236B_GA0070989_10207 [Candidatus Kentron sp. LPFa]